MKDLGTQAKKTLTEKRAKVLQIMRAGITGAQ